MANDRALGGGIFAGSVVGIILYGFVMLYWPLLLLEITAFVAILALLAILAWIGWTMATTPPPEPMSDTPAPTLAPTAESKGPSKSE
jgi:predicted DNA-binding transcriptional regulator